MTRTPTNQPWFGLNIDPSAAGAELALELAAYADGARLELIGIQDHPYNGAFLDTWTLLSFLGARTQTVRLFPNVVSLPLRPPAVLAKAAATLDRLTGGRVVLGLGAGAIWDAIAGYGGPRRSPGEALGALGEAIEVLRLIWSGGDERGRVSFAGRFYSLSDARPGPAPADRIEIWLGALKPRMLELTGRSADGWTVSLNYSPPDRLGAMHAAIDAAAEQHGRTPGAIRRNYNLMGMIQEAGDYGVRSRRSDMLFGSAGDWSTTLVRYYVEYGMDCFVFWPVAGDPHEQARRWAEEVVPAARERIRQELP